MIRINLLPHREAKRKARRQQFYGLLVMVSVLAGLIVFLVYTLISGYITAQEARNDFLKKEIAVLDKQLDEIKRLKEQTQALLWQGLLELRLLQQCCLSRNWQTVELQPGPHWQ